MAHIVVQYERHATERYDMLITPSAGGAVFVRLRSPVVGVTSCRLDPWASQLHESCAARAIQSVVGCFFGEVKASPRIVGVPDWKEVSLEISVVREHQANRLMRVALSADASQRATVSHSNGSGVLRSEALALRPEDADAVFAVTRIALACEPIVLREPQEYEPSFSHVPARRRAPVEVAVAAA